MLAAISTAICFPYIAGIIFLLPSDFHKLHPGYVYFQSFKNSLDLQVNLFSLTVFCLSIQSSHARKLSQSKDIMDVENLVSNAQTETLDRKANVDNESSDIEETNFSSYFSSVSVWKGLGLMFFYQFAGYNVVSFYATSILNRPQETQEELLHPKETNNFLEPVDTLMIQEE